MCIMGCPDFWPDYYILIYYPQELMKSSGYSWQLITAIGDRGYGLTICG